MTKNSWPDLPLETGDLTLRPLEISDAEDIVSNINSREIVMYTLMIPLPYTHADAINFIKDSERQKDEGTTLNLAVVPKETGRLCGVVGLMDFERKHRKASIGYWLGKTQWGKGLIPEAVKAVSEYAFRRLGIHRLEAVIFEPNSRSKRVLERSGFRYEGLMRDRYIKDGQSYNGLVYSRLSTDLPPG